MKKEIKMAALTFLFSVTGLIVFRPLAYSADFTFHVPVELTNVPPNITLIKLSCFVFDSNKQQIGGSIAWVNLDSGRNYTGTVDTSFNANPGSAPGAAKTWMCQVNFVGSGVQAVLPGDPTNYPLDPSKPEKHYVQGTLP